MYKNYRQTSYPPFFHPPFALAYFGGKFNLSCDAIVASHFSHQVIVFERAHINKQSPDWKTAQNITSHANRII